MAETRQTQLHTGDANVAAQHPSPTPQSNQTSPRPCPQDCNRCSMSQQLYCCTRMLFDLSRAQAEASRQIAEVEHAIADIQAQLQPKDSDGQLSIPFIEKS